MVTFTFSHLADTFIQSDLHMCDLKCIHILHLHCWHTAHQELSVLLKDASTGNRTSNLLITKRLLYHCTTVAPRHAHYMPLLHTAPLSSLMHSSKQSPYCLGPPESLEILCVSDTLRLKYVHL